MCGRFALSAKTKSIEKLVLNLKIEDELIERLDIAPTSRIAMVKNNEHRMLEFAHWGLIPSWAKDKSFGKKMFNARAETIAEKPSFRTAFKKRRCLIFADAFYEWKSIDGQKKKEKFIITLQNGEPFTFAGIWENWVGESEAILSTTIITTEPNQTMSEIHNRMPVIIPEKYRELWLSSEPIDSPELLSLLKPYPDEEMIAASCEDKIFFDSK